MRAQLNTLWTSFLVAICYTSWWRHRMETFSALLAICIRNSLVTGEFPTQRPVTWSFDVFFGVRLNKRLSKQWWDAGDLRRHRAHYYVTVMSTLCWGFMKNWHTPLRHDNHLSLIMLSSSRHRSRNISGEQMRYSRRHQMETPLAALALCEGFHRSPVDSLP